MRLPTNNVLLFPPLRTIHAWPIETKAIFLHTFISLLILSSVFYIWAIMYVDTHAQYIKPYSGHIALYTFSFFTTINALIFALLHLSSRIKSTFATSFIIGLCTVYWCVTLCIHQFLLGFFNLHTGVISVAIPMLCVLLFPRALGLFTVFLAFVSIYGIAFIINQKQLFFYGIFNFSSFEHPPYFLFDFITTCYFTFPTLFMLCWVFSIIVRQWRKREIEITKLCEIDDLTRLYNRRKILSDLSRCQTLFSQNNQPMSLMLVDIDHFKVVNDTYGHSVGDFVLAAFAEKLHHFFHHTALIGRYGGEEYLVIFLKGMPILHKQMAEQCRKHFATQPLAYNNLSISVTASFGMASFSPATAITRMLEETDRMLYLAKANGRNRVEAMHAAYD